MTTSGTKYFHWAKVSPGKILLNGDMSSRLDIGDTLNLTWFVKENISSWWQSLELMNSNWGALKVKDELHSSRKEHFDRVFGPLRNHKVYFTGTQYNNNTEFLVSYVANGALTLTTTPNIIRVEDLTILTSMYSQRRMQFKVKNISVTARGTEVEIGPNLHINALEGQWEYQDVVPGIPTNTGNVTHAGDYTVPPAAPVVLDYTPPTAAELFKGYPDISDISINTEGDPQSFLVQVYDTAGLLLHEGHPDVNGRFVPNYLEPVEFDLLEPPYSQIDATHAPNSTLAPHQLQDENYLWAGISYGNTYSGFGDINTRLNISYSHNHLNPTVPNYQFESRLFESFYSYSPFVQPPWEEILFSRGPDVEPLSAHLTAASHFPVLWVGKLRENGNLSNTPSYTGALKISSRYIGLTPDSNGYVYNRGAFENPSDYLSATNGPFEAYRLVWMADGSVLPNFYCAFSFPVSLDIHLGIEYDGQWDESEGSQYPTVAVTDLVGNTIGLGSTTVSHSDPKGTLELCREGRLPYYGPDIRNVVLETIHVPLIYKTYEGYNDEIYSYGIGAFKFRNAKNDSGPNMPFGISKIIATGYSGSAVGTNTIGRIEITATEGTELTIFTSGTSDSLGANTSIQRSDLIEIVQTLMIEDSEAY